MTGSWRTRIRSAVALLAAVLLAWHLNTLGWPWWAWLPAAILMALAVYTVFVLSWFLYRKVTYQHFARRAKRRNRAAED
jgi:membrane protein YdbS with pleckstrin-like domain